MVLRHQTAQAGCIAEVGVDVSEVYTEYSTVDVRHLARNDNMCTPALFHYYHVQYYCRNFIRPRLSFVWSLYVRPRRVDHTTGQ